MAGNLGYGLQAKGGDVMNWRHGLRAIQKNKGAKILAVLAFLGAYTIWLGEKRDTAKAFGFITTGLLLWLSLMGDPGPTAHDKELFKRFLAELPYEPSMRFLKEHAFGGGFPGSRLRPMDDFAYTWADPSLRFNDSRAFEIMETFRTSLDEFRHGLSSLILPIPSWGEETYYQISKPGNWTSETETRYEEECKHADQLASAAFVAYQELVNYGITNLTD